MPFDSGQIWLLIPIVAIVAGTFSKIAKTWMRLKAQQQMLGASNRELEQEVTALQKDRATMLARLENLEAIVVSQTWEAVNAHSLPPTDQERRVASAVRREMAPPAPSYQQRAEELARRLQG
ncbi:MAG TPA: hypothetical protein VGM86_33000 [Thermoanaerobaculia bacterium]|jgi:hypothetical protein